MNRLYIVDLETCITKTMTFRWSFLIVFFELNEKTYGTKGNHLHLKLFFVIFGANNKKLLKAHFHTEYFQFCYVIIVFEKLKYSKCACSFIISFINCLLNFVVSSFLILIIYKFCLFVQF